MEPPFFNSHCRTPYRCTPLTRRSTPAQTTPSKPRVRSIPILDGNEATLQRKQPVRSQPDSAIRIQKAFRGFRVRKAVRMILELKREVDAVERKLQEEATMSVIKRDGMERLKVNENLMVLLFKLDSVRGCNDEIRAFRKAVIRKAIVLQELIDSATDDSAMVVEERESEEVVADDDVENLENSGGIDENPENPKEYEEGKSNGFGEETGNLSNDSSDMSVEDCTKVAEEAMADDKAKQVGTVATTATEDAWECVGEETEEQQKSDVGEEVDNGGAEDREERKTAVKGTSNEEWCVVDGEVEVEKRKKDKLLEKVAEDNQKLMVMMTALFDEFSVQNRMIRSLSQRVENLEMAMNDRLRKKKKKSNASLV